MPVRLRDHLRARQPVPGPALRRPDRRHGSGDLPGGAVNDFESSVAEAIARLGSVNTATLGLRIGAGSPRDTVLSAVPSPSHTEVARRVLDTKASAGVSDAEAGAYIRGVAAGWTLRDTSFEVESVWSGPSSHEVPIRATARVLVELVGEARHELVLMTYSAKPYAPLTEALAAAVERGVSVMAVVETLQGAGSALAGSEPAVAFASIDGVEVWHWPPTGRGRHGAKMHAKLAVADRRVLLVSSANLTQSGVEKNIEAGVLVRGGTAPLRAAEHIAELRAEGVLERLR
ncbi:DISARM system phospholipase D-like protein DrmC [Sphaerisporangium sp. NPDC088356]|uniref:DISARM system phospholipase D-like protein DrmC n=1 Tax=Sphaerisporangium sp. NPDC088356 TaxID=3154871 RepID=UPI0034409982